MWRYYKSSAATKRPCEVVLAANEEGRDNQEAKALHKVVLQQMKNHDQSDACSVGGCNRSMQGTEALNAGSANCSIVAVKLRMAGAKVRPM